MTVFNDHKQEHENCAVAVVAQAKMEIDLRCSYVLNDYFTIVSVTIITPITTIYFANQVYCSIIVLITKIANAIVTAAVAVAIFVFSILLMNTSFHSQTAVLVQVALVFVFYVVNYYHYLHL